MYSLYFTNCRYLQSNGFDFDSKFTEAPGHAVELARDAAKRGCSLIVSVGGDGTINEIINGLHESDCMNNVMLGILNTGTASDYIRTIDIPRAFEDACQCLINPRRFTVDLGVVEISSLRNCVLDPPREGPVSAS